MLNFKCSNCQNDIQVEFEYIGEMVQCPFCTTLQIVPDTMLNPGSLFNQYTITQTITSTPLWTTYEISNQSQNLALSIPTTFFTKQVTNLPEFAQKVISSSSLNQPELPTLINYSIDPNNCYFIFDYDRNTFKLNHFITANPLDYYNTLIVVRNIANTLSQLWDNYNLLHLAIMPENIFISNTLQIKIKNFGLSEYLLQDHHLLECGFNIWDHKYMSPELINLGVANSPSSDIYSLGGILFLLCTGHDPYEHIPPDQIQNAPQPSLKNYIPNPTEGLQILIDMMMENDSNSRLNSWHEVIKYIDKLIANQVTTKQQLNYNTQPNQTSYYQPIGLSTGELTQNISRKSIMNLYDQPLITPEKIKPINKKHISTINKKWDKNKPKRKKKYLKKIPKQDDNAIRLVVISIVGIIALIFILITVISVNNKNKKLKTRRNKPSISYNKRKRIDSLKDKKSTNKKVSKKTYIYEEYNGIDSVITDIKKEILPMLKAGNFDNALSILLEYDGPLEKESYNKRVELAEEIKKRIAIIKKESKEITVSNNSNIPKNKSTSEILHTISKQIAPLMFDGKYENLLSQLDLLSQTSSNKKVKSILNCWIEEIKQYKILEDELNNYDKTDDLIKNKEIMNNAHLLKALLYFNKEEFIKAKQSFIKLPYSLGHLYVKNMEESFSR